MSKNTVARAEEAGMIESMAKTRTTPPDPSPDDPKPTQGSGRKHYKYVGIPVELYERLKRWCDQDERSTGWGAKRAITEFLDKVEKE